MLTDRQAAIIRFVSVAAVAPTLGEIQFAVSAGAPFAVIPDVRDLHESGHIASSARYHRGGVEIVYAVTSTGQTALTAYDEASGRT